jgi:hypothetical protein
MQGGEFLGWNEPRENNAVYHVDSGENHIKIYERGDDNQGLKGRPGWLHPNVNRVRLEFTFGRNTLVRNQLGTLWFLLGDAKFNQMCSRRIHFKSFKDSSPFPKDWEDYVSRDSKGNQECLQEELFNAKKRALIKNPHQCMEDNSTLNSLKFKIIKAINNFEQKWRIQWHNKVYYTIP